MNLRLLKFILFIPVFIACQAGSEIIQPDTDGNGTSSDFSCTLSQTDFTFSHAYDYEPGLLTVVIGEEPVVVDMTQAPWMEVEGNVTEIAPESEVALKIAPIEPNYSAKARSGFVRLKGKYSEQFVDVSVSQAGSYQDTDESLLNGWRLDSNLAPSESWLTGKSMTANKGGLKGLLTLEHSINSDVQVIEDDKRGTFTGMRPGDAVLLRAPVRTVAAGTDVSAMICLAHKTAGAESEWIAEYWDQDKWNGIRPFTTCNDTLDFNYTTFICDFTLKENIVNDYVKLRFRLVSGQENVVNFIAASPWTGAALEVNSGLPAVTDSKKILLLGNSFTYYWGSPFVLKQIARSQGHRLDVRVHTEPGISLGEHATDFSLSRDAVNEGSYDFAILQEQSNSHAKYADGAGTAVLNETSSLVGAIRAESATCRFILENTWAYAQDNYKGYGSYMTFYEKLVFGCKEIASALRIDVSPVGTAFRMMYENHPEINCMYTDDHHPSRNGAYLKSCVNYLMLYGGEFNAAPYNGEASAENAAVLREVAYKAVNDIPEENPKEQLKLVADFAVWPFIPNLVSDKNDKIKTKDAYTLTQDGVEYQFEIYAPSTGYYNAGTSLRFEDQGGGYLKLPAIEGKALVEITVEITNTSNKAVYVSSDGSDKGDILGSTSIPASGSKTCKLIGTLPGTSYYLYTKAKHTQIGKVILTYE